VKENEKKKKKSASKFGMNEGMLGVRGCGQDQGLGLESSEKGLGLHLLCSRWEKSGSLRKEY